MKYVEMYHDESGERFQQLFKDAEAIRAQRKLAAQQTIFWCSVIFVLVAVVGVKLWTMGAVVGLK
jgi:hypothetical protein